MEADSLRAFNLERQSPPEALEHSGIYRISCLVSSSMQVYARQRGLEARVPSYPSDGNLLLTEEI